MEEFQVTMLCPLLTSLSEYNRLAPPDQQPVTVNTKFLGAMYVREQVFVKEQGVALDRELDSNDSHCYHWIIFTISGSLHKFNPEYTVGTIRLIPPIIDSREDTSMEDTPYPTAFPDQPYFRIGRLAVLAGYRGKSLGSKLIEEVLMFIKNNAMTRFGGINLVYVHAQRDRTVPLWKRYGFIIDKGMGEWDEEGMMHVGMWKKVIDNE